jgi:hypothetical protein
MDKHLVTISAILTRVEAEKENVTRHLIKARAGDITLFVLGVKGKQRYLVTREMIDEKLPEDFQKVARQGLLFVLKEGMVECFAPDLSEDGLPLMMERADAVIARRSKAGPAPVEKPAPPEQVSLNLNK